VEIETHTIEKKEERNKMGERNINRRGRNLPLR